MDSNELLKKVRKIEIKTKGLSQNIFAGEYHSAFKGRGMTFSEVREYQYGDDVRDIDWNVTARHNRPYIKVYEEEREMTVMLLIDVSGSRMFGAQGVQKREMIAEIAATLAFSAIQNNDKVGLMFFTDKIEKFIPPKKGKNDHHSQSPYQSCPGQGLRLPDPPGTFRQDPCRDAGGSPLRQRQGPPAGICGGVGKSPGGDSP